MLYWLYGWSACVRACARDCLCCCCCCFPLVLGALFNLHAEAGLIGSIFPPAARQRLSAGSASEFTRPYSKLEKKRNTFFMIVWTRCSRSWEISIPSGGTMSRSRLRLLAIFITWGGREIFILFLISIETSILFSEYIFLQFLNQSEPVFLFMFRFWCQNAERVCGTI